MTILKFIKQTSLSTIKFSSIHNLRLLSQNAPRRALLYVPGDSERKLKKACGLNVDCITMDCEDGVAINKKQAARETIHHLLNEGRPKSNFTYDLSVRPNSVDSGLCEDDLSMILTAKTQPDTIVLPKVDNENQLKWFAERVKKFMPSAKTINLVMLIESAISLMSLPHICKTAKELSSQIIPTSLIFGSDDFCANIGVTRTESSIEILYARQKLVLVAKAFGLQAIDMVYINYKDLVGLEKQCEEGMRMGYTGKQVIHPNQVPIAHKAFLPTKEQVEWASGLITAFDKHQAGGVGAFTYKGSMIDMPTLRQAKNIIELTKAIK